MPLTLTALILLSAASQWVVTAILKLYFECGRWFSAAEMEDEVDYYQLISAALAMEKVGLTRGTEAVKLAGGYLDDHVIISSSL